MNATRSLGVMLTMVALALATAAAFHGTQAIAQGAASQDSAAKAWAKISAENKEDADEVRDEIRSHENSPAESVFKNIKVMKGVPAGRLVNAMEFGFAPALGAKCTLCHTDDGKWESENKKEKQVARDMMAMSRAINDTLLARIPNLESTKPQVTCTTCHRGQKKPATMMTH